MGFYSYLDRETFLCLPVHIYQQRLTGRHWPENTILLDEYYPGYGTAGWVRYGNSEDHHLSLFSERLCGEGMQVKEGLVQVYTGDGKGKTTAALGLALRAAGRGMKVFIVQFLKGRLYGEIESVKRLSDRIVIVQSGLDSFVKKGEPTEEDIRLARRGLNLAAKAISSGEYDIVILDEINVAVELGVLSVDDVIPLIENKPGNIELILTGRYAPDEFLKRADLITEMRNIKHYYNSGVKMREGIEY